MNDGLILPNRPNAPSLTLQIEQWAASGRIMRPVDVTLQGEIVGRMVSAGAGPAVIVLPASQRAKAWRDIENIQWKVGRMMKRFVPSQGANCDLWRFIGPRQA